MKFSFRSSVKKNKNHDKPQLKSRRLFLKMMGLGAGVSATGLYAGVGKDIAGDILKGSRTLADGISLTIYRPQDLLQLDLTFIGFKKAADGKSLIRSGSPNMLIASFPPQSIAEQAYEEVGGQGGQANFDDAAKSAIKSENGKNMSSQAAPFPAKTYISGNSRLVFTIPSSKQTINLTAKDLLDWSGYKIEVNNRATCTPIYTVKDDVPVYHGFGNGVITTPNKVPDQPGKTTTPVVTPTVPVKINRTNTEVPVNNTTTPIKIGRTNTQVPVQNGTVVPVRGTANGRQADSLQRQVAINKEMRGATKNEAQVIQQKELPIQVIQPATDYSMLGGLTILKTGKTPRPVDESETSIEMPYRLFISPNQFAVWQHEHALKNRDDLQGQQVATYELWHSRLHSTNCNGIPDKTGATKSIKTVRALWGIDIDGEWSNKPTRDYSPDGSGNNGNGANKFVTALYNDDRHCIVHESSNFDIKGFSPKNVQVNELMLTCLGASFNAEMLVKRKELQDANVLSDLNLLKWKHIATLARDHYVEVVYAGNMFPFGHEASLVRITERKPKANYATNYQRYFLVVNEEEKKYNPYNPVNGNFKQFPFSTVKFVTTATPSIDPITKTFAQLDDDQQHDHQFMPYVNGKPYNFKLKAFDLDGNEQDFEMPLVFVSTNVSLNNDGTYNIVNLGKICMEYRSKSNEQYTKINFHNQKLSLARSKTKGDTNFQTSAVAFEGVFTLDESPGFRPGTTGIDIYITAVENLTGKRQAQKVTLVDDKNDGNVFAKLVTAQSVNFTSISNKTGGSLAPNFDINSLSKTLGAVGGTIDSIKNLNFDPDKFFADSAKLFGVIDLGKIIQKVTKAATSLSADSIQSPIPALKNIETDKAHITQYIWTGATLQEYGTSFFKFQPKGNSSLHVETNLYRYKDTAKQSLLTVSSYINNFSIEIAKLAAVNFNKVAFTTGSNAKVDVSVEMGSTPLVFLGALTFVNTLQKYIPADGFSDPPYLDVSTDGITAGYSLGLPDIQLGAFSLRHVTLGASITLPFTGAPLSMKFNFCEKQQPFTLTVSALGGGGFFAVEFDVNGLRSLEAALEFGAAVSINLGVASGAVSIMGGIYFKVTVMEDDTKQFDIEGYVRINGAVCVLGLITASIEFLLTLAGEIGNVNGKEKVKRVWGTATLKIKIEIFMFSKTVHLTTSKEFAGAGADPTFAMMISNDDWWKYCETFAA